MNYRTMAKGALALSLSLIVGSAMAETTSRSDIQKYGATFESTVNTTAGQLNDFAYEEGTNVTKYATAITDGNPHGWFGAAEDESKIIARTDAAGGQALQLNTDAGTLTNKLESTLATDINNNGIAAAGAYIETEAKFVASDTLDAGVVGGTDDTKFAIYAYADENASPCTTNLVVYHAYYDGNVLKYTNEVFNTLIDCDVYTKLRVEMKQLESLGGSMLNVFSVKVGNNEALTSDLAYDNNIWFLTVEEPLDDNNKLLSSINFKGTGEVDNLAVGIINETTTYAIDWSASQNVIASNLTANAQLAAGDTNFVDAVQLAFYPTEGNVITNVLVNGVESRWNDNCFEYTVSSSTGDEIVTVLAGTQSAPATVITVAAVGGATYTEQDGVYTFTAPQGYTISSIFTNGVDTGSTTTLDLSAADGNVKVVVAATKTRTASEHKWYENPGKVYSYDSPISGGGEDQPGCNWALENENDFIFDTKGWTIGGGMLYDFNEIEGNANTENILTPIWKVARAKFGVDLRGGTVSKEHNVVIIGVYNAANAFAAPISADAADENGNLEDYVTVTFKDMSGNTLYGVSAYRFSADGQYLYAGGNNAYIYKFALAGVDFSSNVELKAIAEYSLDDKSRNFAYGVVNGSEVIFAVQDNLTIKRVDLATGTVANAGITARTKYDQLNIAGTSLYVGQSVNGASSDDTIVILKRYSIDGSFGLTLEQSWTKGEMLEICGATANAGVHPMAFAVSSDEKSLLITFQTSPQTRYLLQYVEPQVSTYTVDWNGSAGVTVSTNAIAITGTSGSFEENTVVTFTPDQYMAITNILVGGVAQTGFDPASFALTVVSDTNVVVLASYFPRTATAGQDGTAEHPFEIEDVDDILALKAAFAANASWRSKNYKVVADIDATDLGYFDGIGTANGTNNDTGLSGGTFDGDGHTISNVKFTNAKYRGFFNQMDNGATIKNLTINVVDITNKTAAAEHGYAAFVGNMKNSKLVNCVATGTIGTVAKPAMHTSAGFAVKVAEGGVSVFVNCTNKIDIVCSLNDNPKVGGIAGLFEGGVLTNCYNEGDITITCKKCGNNGNGAGGLIGYAQSHAVTIYHSGNAGTIQSTDTTANGADKNGISYDIKVGTIIGMQNSSTATVSGGTIAQADAAPAGARANITGLDFATVDNNVATFVETLAAGNTYKVMQDGATATYEFAEAGTIAFNTAMYTPTYAITVASGSGLDLTNDAGSPVITYTAAASAPAGYNYPEGGAIEDADIVAWLTAKGFTQADVTALTTNAKLNECYLLNCDISQSGAGGSIAITGITVSGSSVTVTVTLTRTAGIAGGINGTLKLYGTADLATAFAELDSATVTDADFSEGDTTTATLSGGSAKFFKAVIE